jgi:hypothetical protein
MLVAGWLPTSATMRSAIGPRCRHPLFGLWGAWHHCSGLVSAWDALDLWACAALERAAHPLAPMLMYLGGPLFTGLTSVGIPLYGRASGITRGAGVADRCESGTHRGPSSNVYDRAVIWAGPLRNYAGSRTTTNDP